MTPHGLSPGRPHPLGVTPDETGVNVAVGTRHATRVLFCLFDDTGTREVARIPLPERTGDVVHGHIAGIRAGARYGLRVEGPFEPRAGHRFNAHKLLLDPFARAIDRPFVLHRSMFGHVPGHRDADLSFDDTDSAHVMPKAIVTAPPPPNSPRVLHDPRDRVIYELHAKGFTILDDSQPEATRGTFAGLAAPRPLAHLKRIGVTTVEVMPLAAMLDERHLPPLGLTNYWGYAPAAFLAPDPRRAPGGFAEIAASVARLAEAGIETLIDVVLNHTAEGDEHGPTVSLRGLDNALYYRLRPGDERRYVDDAGCGNVLALERPAPLALALASLRAWATATGVAGFRYDLATTLARRVDGFDPDHPVLLALRDDPVLAPLVHVVEPWDIGPGGYKLGDFPAGTLEWNDRFRDTIRRFWRGDAGMLGDLATRFAGSADVFGATRRATASVNFVAAHDGFTLADLVAYASKRNEANGEGNRDGTDQNHSWAVGGEGPASDPEVVAARSRDIGALLATLFLARGTPMLAMGDEAGRTQDGNNNAYAQDNTISWLDWGALDGARVHLVAELAAARARHPALRGEHPLTGDAIDESGIPDVAWMTLDGAAMVPGDWSDPDRRAILVVLAARDSEGIDRVAIVINGGREAAAVRLPLPRAGFRWVEEVSSAGTSLPSPLRGDSELVEGGETSSLPSSLAGEGGPRETKGGVREEPTPASSRLPLTLDPSATRGGGRESKATNIGRTAAVPPRSVTLFAEIPDTSRPRSGVDDALLARVARAAGIAPEWWEVDGTHHRVSLETERALLAAMRLPVTTASDARAALARLAEPVHRALPFHAIGYERDAPTLRLPLRDGTRTRLTLTLETGEKVPITLEPGAGRAVAVRGADGRSVTLREVRLPVLPLGRHLLARDEAPNTSCRLVIAPRRCVSVVEKTGRERVAGLGANLYALRDADDLGIGGLGTLAKLAERAREAGLAAVTINPLHALFSADAERASPYHPSDRRFRDPRYLDGVALVREMPALAPVMDTLGPRIAGARALPAIDHAAVAAIAAEIAAAAFAARDALPDSIRAAFAAFVAEGGERLGWFATHEVLAARFGTSWTHWPNAYRDPATMPRVDDEARDAVIFTQFLLDRQLAAAGRGFGLGLMGDLAVGCAPDGAEAWAEQALLMMGCSIGAPPDPFSAAGQVWNLPPPDPHATAREGFDGFAALLAANLAHMGGLRIDHVMGLTRLFIVPEGAPGSEGAYVAQDLDARLAELTLASRRANAIIAGEDLGTVPDGLADRLAAANVLGTDVLLFAREGGRYRASDRFRAAAMAAVTTHDLPTVLGWRRGADVAERARLGLIVDETAARADRADEVAALAGTLGVDPSNETAFVAAAHAHLSASPAALVVAQADDLAGETVGVNLPGTDRERPNWRRRVAVPVEELFLRERAKAILGAVVR